jgi:hypothetical protein
MFHPAFLQPIQADNGKWKTRASRFSGKAKREQRDNERCRNAMSLAAVPQSV